ncbi:MAG: efflux RND transporter periplasmic adaptor subunit, partial [Alphaproteobacteria bacterium]
MNLKVVAVAGVAVIAAGGAGVLIGRMSAHPSAPKASEAAAPAKAGEIAMSSERIRAAGIDLVAVGKRQLSLEIVAQGTVAAASDAEGVLAARSEGTVVRLLKRLGDPVQAGETVALIESRDASNIVAERSKAQADAETSRAKYSREKQLFDAGVTARQDLEAARAELAGAEAELERSVAAAAAARVSSDGRSVAVVSPVSGRISAAPIAFGAFVAPGAEIYRVVNPGRVEIRATVPPEEAARITAGETATFEANGVQAAAVVRAVAPEVDPANRSATIILDPRPGPGGLRPGASVQVRIAARGSATPVLVVPVDALQIIDGREAVFVRTDEGFEVRPVVVGERAGGVAAITRGLAEGETVAGRG